jgi:NAD(P)-dependent dehydrogenase (short-subunit alcohol dehydrogenase family)
MVNIETSVVLVTGANGGLGSEFVAQALERGATRVYAAARSTMEWSDPRVMPLTLDVTDPNSIAAAAAAAPDVTVVVNNAGIVRHGSLVEGSFDDIRATMETNFFAPLAVTRAFAPALRAAKGGLINIGSIASWLPLDAYGASKAALWSATNAIRVELAPSGVHVLGAYLAYTRTPMTEGMDVEKNDPTDVVKAILDGLEAGHDEVLADETTRQVRSGLGLPIASLLAAVNGN